MKGNYSLQEKTRKFWNFIGCFLVGSLFILSFADSAYADWPIIPDIQQYKWEKNRKYMNMNCESLEKDFIQLREELEHIPIGKETLQSLHTEYNKKLATKLAYQGLRQLISDFLNNMMSYHNSLNPDEKLETLDQVISSVSNIKAMGGLLQAAVDPKTGRTQGFNLSKFLKNPHNNQEHFLEEIKLSCRKFPKSKICLELYPFGHQKAPATKVYDMLKGFYQIAVIGDFNPEQIKNFQKYFEDKSQASGFSLSSLTTLAQKMKLNDLRSSIKGLRACRKESWNSYCSDHDKQVRELEAKLENIQNQFEGVFVKDELKNFASTTQDLFKYNKSNMNTELFYKKLSHLKFSHLKKQLRDGNMQMRKVLISICKSPENINIVTGNCKMGSRLMKRATPAQIDEIQKVLSNRKKYIGKIKDAKFAVHWRDIWKKSQDERNKFDEWVREKFATPKSREAWNALIDSTSLQCAKVFSQNDNIDIQACLRTFTRTNPLKNEIETALREYKTGAENGVLKGIVKKLNSPLKEVASDFLEILLRNWKKDGGTIENFPMCPSLKSIPDGIITADNVSLPQIIDCLEDLNSKEIKDLENNLDQEIQGIVTKLKTFEENEKVQDYLTRLSGAGKALVQEKCLVAGDVLQEFQDVLIPHCQSNDKNKVPFLDFFTKLNKAIGKIDSGSTVSQKKLLAEMKNHSEGPQSETVQTMLNIKETDKMYKDKAKAEDNSYSSPANYVMGAAMGLPAVFPMISDIFSTQQYHGLLYHHSSNYIWYQHYARMSSAMYGGFGNFGGGYSGFR